jgi:hypothetical protein
MSYQDDWNLIYMPLPDGAPKIEEGPLPTKDVLAIATGENPFLGNDAAWQLVRRLAQEVVQHRWKVCEESQGGRIAMDNLHTQQISPSMWSAEINGYKATADTELNAVKALCRKLAQEVEAAADILGVSTPVT